MCLVFEFNSAEWFPNPHGNLAPWSPSSALSPPTAGTVLLGTPRESSPEENHPLPKVVTLETATAQGSPASYQSASSKSGLIQRNPGRDKDLPQSHSFPFPSWQALCLLQVRVCPSLPRTSEAQSSHPDSSVVSTIISHLSIQRPNPCQRRNPGSFSLWRRCCPCIEGGRVGVGSTHHLPWPSLGALGHGLPSKQAQGGHSRDPAHSCSPPGSS